MRLRIIVTDYGETIAKDGALDPRVRAAMAVARNWGVLMVIVKRRRPQRSLEGPFPVKKHMEKNAVVVLTIGHSSREISDFLQLLQAHDVACLVDVRTIPRSRHNPQFNKDTLPATLKTVGIQYQHLEGLGGLRHTRRDSPNGAWRNSSFRGYADYMQTSEFETSVQILIDLARRKRVALMCAEAVPWRCHRSLIADALIVRGLEVEHIMSATRCNKHTLRPWAVVKGTHITYPPEAGSEPDSSGKSPTKSRVTTS